MARAYVHTTTIDFLTVTSPWERVTTATAPIRVYQIITTLTLETKEGNSDFNQFDVRVRRTTSNEHAFRFHVELPQQTLARAGLVVVNRVVDFRPHYFPITPGESFTWTWTPSPLPSQITKAQLDFEQYFTLAADETIPKLIYANYFPGVGVGGKGQLWQIFDDGTHTTIQVA